MTSTSWGDATALLTAAGVAEDTGYYRGFTAPDEKAALTVAMRIQAAWAANDADAFADVFTDDGSLLLQDTQLTSREQIRDHMARGFAGGLKGARVLGGPVHVSFLTPEVAMVITEGGIVRPGERAVAPADQIRATWVITRRGGTPALVSHQSSPVHG
ncbi:SgcJ/EcaC family oxidoreductase [Actinoplanes teichomyceticus]|uniref:Uncharacterized protein (TIGR02246 family) n=1 Tax=Actinoplanes teichomyceticus TaxID=1867 RepID=A0A561WBV5_ACTTI|nr:SgcJ/EcaC family oxidoreductase [Actinoplanes teichomyceticus]TWG21346.1 uncharacterized protein (TIGR02246 family) [Actinoplanes teichomyceticus]GIF16431.1 hypothetical protein Ate01nite_64630 [Actinoplanes teichomyceticus]